MERLDFAGDMPDERDDTRFKRHNRFLRSLREDILRIVDNFNVTAFQNQFLDVMLKYRCRILFTTRSGYENHLHGQREKAEYTERYRETDCDQHKLSIYFLMRICYHNSVCA